MDLCTMQDMCCVFLMCLLFQITSRSQEIVCDSIVWSESRNLQWKDFRAVPDSASAMHAGSSTGIFYSGFYRNDTLSLAIKSLFLPCASWHKSRYSVTLLLHEQVHFNITEYFRRMFTKMIASPAMMQPDLIRWVDSCYQEVLTYNKAFHSEYDHKTAAGKDFNAQQLWKVKVDVLLQHSEPYKQDSVIIIRR